MTEKNIAIHVRQANKHYGTFTAVKSLDFDVRHAECYGLLGPNGAGKTTMMKILYGMVQRDAGPSTVQVFGHDPRTDELKIKYISGIVQQEDNLDTELSVTRNLLIYARFYGMSRAQAMPRIDELLEFMELTEKRNSRIRELSGGMKRRLSIARALLNDPKLLILDEPTTGLDPQVRHTIWDKVRALKDAGTTVLLTTHYMDEAFQLCDTLAIMHEGEKVLEGPPTELVEREIEPWVLEIFRVDGITIDEQEGVRIDRSSSRIFLFSADVRRLESIAATLQKGSFYLRQSNLEDLFLKTTGRQLHE